MGIDVRNLTLGDKGRAEHAPYPPMSPLSTAIPRNPSNTPTKVRTRLVLDFQV